MNSRSAAQPWRVWREDHAPSRRVLFRVEPAVVGGVRDESADVRVQAPSDREQHAAIRGYRGVTFEEVVQAREAALPRMRTLRRLGELHLVADEDNAPCGEAHCDGV